MINRIIRLFKKPTIVRHSFQLTRVNNVGIYLESDSKPCYEVQICRIGRLGSRIIHKYYMLWTVYRTIGMRETQFGLPSVQSEYGTVVDAKYVYYENIPALVKTQRGFTFI